MTVEKSYKPKVHGVVDLETLSTDKNAAIIDIACVIALGTTEPREQFAIKIKPSQYKELTQFAMDQSTWEFHEKQNPGYLSQCEVEGVTIQEAVQAFIDFLAPYAANFDLHMWSQGKDFDFPIIDFALRQTGLKVPYSYGKVHCLRDLVWLNPGARLKWKPEIGGHTALVDAGWEAEQLRAVVSSSTWYQRLFK